MMRVVRDLPLISECRYCRCSHHLFITEVHLLKLYPHVHHLLLDIRPHVIIPCKLPQIVFMYSFLSIIARKVEVLHLKLPDTQLLLIEYAHVWTQSIINILLSILLLNDLLENLFKQSLLLLHHSLHLFLRLLLKPKLSFFYILFDLCLQYCLLPLLFLFFHGLFFLKLFLFLLEFSFLVCCISICEGFPQILSFIHKCKILLLFFPRSFIFFYNSILLAFWFRFIRVLILIFLFIIPFLFLLSCRCCSDWCWYYSS